MHKDVASFLGETHNLGLLMSAVSLIYQFLQGGENRVER